MADDKANFTDRFLKNPKAVPTALGVGGGLLTFSGLFGRKEKTDENGEMHKESLFNWRTLIGGVLSVTAFTMIARKNGMQPNALRAVTDKLHLGGHSV